MCNQKMILALLICVSGNMPVFADDTSILSLKPFETCRKPPISPPKKLLNKSYKTYIFPGNWVIFDVNGDGWCDWVRGGNEGYRSDEEYPPLREFIYLGTAKGWRHFDQPKVKHGEIDEWGKEVTLIAGDYAALNFVQPFPIYIKGTAKPYVATVIRFDAPAPPPNRENINVYHWNDTIDKLQKVSEKERIRIVGFLYEKLCKHPAELTADGGEPFLLAQGDLCFPKK